MRKEIKMEPKVARASFFVSVAVKVGLQQFLRLKESKAGAGEDFLSFEPSVRFPELSLCLVLAFKSFLTSKTCLFSFSCAQRSHIRMSFVRLVKKACGLTNI